MGFKEVYQTLTELFPQVDSRLLKAVAIEHSKDPDEAVEYILNEVLPFAGDKLDAPTTVVENDGKTAKPSNASSSVPGSISGDVAIAAIMNDGHNLGDESSTLTFYDANDSDNLSGNYMSSSTPLKINEVIRSEAPLDERPSATVGLGEVCRGTYSEALGDLKDVSSIPSQDREDLHVNMVGDVLSPFVSVDDGAADINLANVENTLEREVSTECAIEDQISGELSWTSHQEAENDSNVHDANVEDMNTKLDSEFTLGFSETDGVGAECETLSRTIVTRSGQICGVSLLEEILEEAKNCKETVCSEMESVVRLMEDVEHQESEAEQAKVASTRGGLDILEKVDEIKNMLIHAKEANDMHAGEVYGEKSILAIEVKELQARLLGLSDDKDKSLFMLDEMRKSLQERLAVAEEQRRAAEKETFDKQELAQAALDEQELIMDKVVQESKLLQQEAEENAKLRDFLMEKGQVVDVLQGEISVICQDVKLLKENLDNRVSLSKLLSVERKSFRLSSSNSSVKSTASLKSVKSLKRTTSSKSSISVKSTASDVSDLATDRSKFSESPKSLTLESSVEWQNHKSEYGQEYARHEATTGKPDLEDWELCDMISTP